MASSLVLPRHTNIYGSVVDDPALFISPTFTVEVFATHEVAAPLSDEDFYWVHKDGQWRIGFRTEEATGDFRVIYSIYYANGSYTRNFVQAIPLCAWHHFALCISPSGADDLAEIFMDGNRIDSQIISSTFGALVDSTGNHYLGIMNAAIGGLSFPWFGRVNGLRLSDSQRYSGAIYTVPSYPFVNDGNTKGLWLCNEGTGTTLADLSGNGNNITINGAALWADEYPGEPCPGFIDVT